MREYVWLEIVAPIELPRTKWAGGHLRWWVKAGNPTIFEGLAVCHGKFVPSEMLVTLKPFATGIARVRLLQNLFRLVYRFDWHLQRSCLALIMATVVVVGSVVVGLSLKF